MTRRIFRCILLVATLSTLLAAALILQGLFAVYQQDLAAELRAEAEFLVFALSDEADEAAALTGLSAENRVSLIAPDGRVLYDNQADAGSMGSHADRPEVMAALREGEGELERYSATFEEATLYCALRTEAGNVLRLSCVRMTAFGLGLRMTPLLGAIFLLTAFFSLLMARLSAQRIVSPIRALNLSSPLENETYDEIRPMLERISRQKRARDEARQAISTMMDNMSEGMILLDFQGKILAMNAVAERVLNVNPNEADMLSAAREPSVREAAYEALTGRSAALELDFEGRNYRLIAHPVEKEKKTEGAVLLLLDVTEHFAAERSRREFTANVSHELKTPLTSVSGYAELIRDGIARPEDIPAFAGRIYDEARRLLRLIEDIMALSRLDEKRGLGEMERVQLDEIAEECALRLLNAAEKKGVTLTLHAQAAETSGYRTLVGEMIFNLVDNAVKYTNEGGFVEIRVENDASGAKISVSDTGVGIPKEHQAHIFERFYRVDKSHSRATGGTGLGLSIVKHGAEIHHAKLTLESEVGRGTCVTLVFPRPQAGAER